MARWHHKGKPVIRITIIVLTALIADLLLAVGVGRFIRAGRGPVPPEPDGMPLLTTYATKPDQP